MFETLKSGGPLMIPILLCAVIAVFIIIERIVYFIGVNKRDKKLMETILSDLDKRDYSAAETDCAVAGTPTAQVIRTALNHRNLDEKHLQEIVQTKMDTVIPQFEHLLTALGTIANVSTLLGLLGTVTGNIKAFGVLGGGGTMGDPALLASSIGEALVTTVGGLCVSIPSLIFHSMFNNIVNHRIRDMEASVSEAMLSLNKTGVL